MSNLLVNIFLVDLIMWSFKSKQKKLKKTKSKERKKERSHELKARKEKKLGIRENSEEENSVFYQFIKIV